MVTNYLAAALRGAQYQTVKSGTLPLLGLGVDGIEWPQPVRPGDNIQVEMEVLAIRPSKSQPTHGIVKIRTTARNQRGEIVYVVTPNCWVQRRPV